MRTAEEIGPAFAATIQQGLAMCSRHEHVQAVVARLNAGEHMPEVKLGGSLIGKTGIADVVTPLKENLHVRHVNLASKGFNEFGTNSG